MTSTATTLGNFIADLMARHDYSNRSLAAAAGVSESAIRNLLKVGEEQRAKDPDARTLSLVAKALEVDALRLFRLAGYIPPEPSAHSARGEFLARMVDELPLEKQDAVLGVLEAMIENSQSQRVIREMRENLDNRLAGIDQKDPVWIREVANYLMMQLKITGAYYVQTELIDPETDVLVGKWSDISRPTQERIIALIQHKLALQYDPTMVDPEWRD